jgi:hypothetical protein
MTIWRMRIACWIMKATNAHSECVILSAFRLQQRLYERDAVLRYTYVYIACLVLYVCGTRSLAVGEVCQQGAGEKCGCKREELSGGWRKMHTVEVHDLYSLSCINGGGGLSR